MTRGSMKRWGTVATLLSLMALAAACGTKTLAAPDIQDASFATSLGIDLADFTKTSSGLWYQDVTVGEGATPVSGDSVQVTVQGWFRDATVFQPLQTFDIVVGGAIPGFNEGLEGMKVGGVRRLILPPELGYGTGGNPQAGIPANAILVFKVELKKIYATP